MELSIIIVNHNTKKLTNQTIGSIIKNTKDIEYEIIIVDNSSSKEEVCDFHDSYVKLMTNVENKGFGYACNIGASNSSGEYILFLNSDTIIKDNCLKRCVDYLKLNPIVGVLGAKVVLEDGSLDHGCKRGFPTPAAAMYYYMGMDKKHPESKKYGAYRQTFLDSNETNEVDSVSGAFLMINRQIYEHIGGFDETFFMYGEDLDLCYRVKEKGYKVVYFPKAVITHLKGQSGLYTKSKIVIYHFYNAMILFYDKHYKDKYNLFVTLAVYTGIKLKYKITLLKMKLAR